MNLLEALEKGSAIADEVDPFRYLFCPIDGGPINACAIGIAYLGAKPRDSHRNDIENHSYIAWSWKMHDLTFTARQALNGLESWLFKNTKASFEDILLEAKLRGLDKIEI